MKYHILYKTTNTITGEFYVGMHNTSNVDDGYLGSGTNIKRSIEIYGVDAHTREILEFCESEDDLRVRERQMVNNALLSESLCINIRRGGKGGWTRDQQIENNRRSQESVRINGRSEHFRTKTSTRIKEQYKSGERVATTKPHVVGEFKHSPETKELLSNTKRGTNTGKDNSQHGVKWMYNDVEQINKKVQPRDVNTHLSTGWALGRRPEFYGNK
jgi:hypothetical protein